MKLPPSWKHNWIIFLIWWKKAKKQLALRIHFLQDDLYEIDVVAHPYLRMVSALLILLVLASVLLPIAFHLSPELVLLNSRLEIGLMAGFVIHFIIRFTLTSRRIEFLKQRWLELLFTLISSVFLLEVLIDTIPLELLLGGTDVAGNELFLVLLKAYLLLIAGIKVLQYLPELLQDQSNSARFLVNSFLILIAAGTFLLMLPGATIDGVGLSFIDALFTATSSVCVTGLIVVDTATHFTTFGQVVILILIQLGGLGIITFATFLFLFISDNIGIGQMKTLKTMVAESNTSLAVTTLRRVVGLTLFAELLGAIAYFFSWTVSFESVSEKIFFSIFHAVSAFCNAGFSLFTNSLADHQNAVNVSVNITTMSLIIVGGLGFTVVWELITRSRMSFPNKKRMTVHTRIVLITTGVLIICGSLFYLILEWNNTLSGYSAGNKIMLSFFQSITTRTAGFNTVDIGAVDVSTILIMLSLMLIGGSPASTAGGIKTTTVAVLFRSVVMTIRGFNKMELFKRTIPSPVIFQAVSVIILAITCISISTVLLTLAEDLPFLDLLFEEISAFATVGLSRGITADLSSLGKGIIITSMFLGRVGILTFMMAFARQVDAGKYRYPDEKIIIT